MTFPDDFLNKTQINRQDFVDNAIFELLKELNPSNQQLNWDIEIIARIRDEARLFFVDEKHICSEQEFYPFIEE